MARNDGGLGKADPWPTNDTPIHGEASPHQTDGYYQRLPLAGHYEAGSDYWLDEIIYPERAMGSDRQDLASRVFALNEGNITGRKPGPSTDGF